MKTKTVIAKMTIGVLYCEKCAIPIQMTEHRGIYCPKCKECSLVNKEPEYILHCAECEQPLNVLEEIIGIKEYGSYCLNCEFTPSLQDTYLQKI